MVATIPSAARPASNAGAVARPSLQLQDNKSGENAKNPKPAINNPIVVTAVVSTTKTPPGFLASGATVQPSQDGPPENTVPAEATAPEVGSRNRHGSRGTAAKLSPPEQHLEGSPKALPRTTAPNSSGDSKLASREPPGVSKLRAPGWGREALICSIPPAPNAPGATKLGTVPAKTARDIPAAPTATALLPWDLLTPVTEAATVDERSVASHGTRGTTRMAPAYSVASGSKPDKAEASGAVRERIAHRNPHHLWADSLRTPSAAPCICEEKTLAQTGESGNRRKENVGTWGTSTIGGGARSAQGQRSAPWTGRASPCGGPLTSLSAYRASPTCGTSDGAGTRGSSFSGASGERTPGRQAGGGYIAAMGRRARSVARREAARRSVAAAMAANKTRPSTPISERARWGKGRESQVEERKKLLQRRTEYAEELQRKAKVVPRGLCCVRAVALIRSCLNCLTGVLIVPALVLVHL